MKVDGEVFERDHFTDDVVGKLIVDEVFHVLHHFIDKPSLLLRAAAFQASLHDAAALFVPGNLETVLNNSFINWLFVSW